MHADLGSQTRCTLVDEVIDNEGPTAASCETYADDGMKS